MLSKYTSLYKVMFILSIVVMTGNFVLPSFCCAVEMPKDFGEAGGFVMQIVRGLPDAMRESWGEAKETWRKTWVKWWVEKIRPYLQESWGKVKVLLDKQIERAKTLLSGKYFDTMDQQGSVIRQEFEKEKQEMISELSKYTKPIIDKIKGIFSFENFFKNIWEKIKFWK